MCAPLEGWISKLTLTSDLRLGFEGGQANARTLLKEGDVRYLALSWGGALPPMDYAEAYKRQVWTAHHWQHWLARGQFLITRGAAICSEAPLLSKD